MATYEDIILRLKVSSESDALDFEKTGRMAIVVEDGDATLPLPKGDPGPQGPAGPRGGKMIPDLVLDESTDSEALAKLKTRSRAWTTAGEDRDQYFALNKATKTAFFFTRGGWVTVRDVFGGSTEVVAAEMTLPMKFSNVTSAPPTPSDGVVLYAEGNQLKMKNPSGTVKVLG